MMRNPRAYLVLAALLIAVPFQACRTASTQVSGGKASMKLGIVMTTTDPETVFNAFRLANYSVENGDKVSVFLLGERRRTRPDPRSEVRRAGNRQDLPRKGWQGHGLWNLSQAAQFGRFGTVPTFDPEGPS